MSPTLRNLMRHMGGRPAAAAPPAWVPSDFGADLELHYDTSDSSDTSKITVVSGACSQLKDLSGNARHISHGTAANRPAIISAWRNGLDGIEFDGINDDLASAADVILITNGQALFLWCVYQIIYPGSDAHLSMLLSFGTTSSNTQKGFEVRIDKNPGTAGREFVFGNGGSSPQYGNFHCDLGGVDTNPHILSLAYDGNDCDTASSYGARLDNSAKSVVVTALSQIQSNLIRMGTRAGSFPGNFRMGELFISRSDSSEAYTYLANKWGF